MKKLLMLTCLTLLTVGIASAQIINFTMKSPFSVGNANLPAGTYQIHAADSEQVLFECTNESKGTSVMFEVDPSEVIPKTSGVTFAKYNDKLVLKSFSIAGGQSWLIPISLAEKQAKKSGAKPTKVTTPAN
ncbi:MAG: hypothetical protein WBW33_25650 [Bryobacteraceae bacterium]